MLVPQRQQSATISHRRMDMGAEHSGQAQESTSPSSQIVPPRDGSEAERLAGANSRSKLDWLSAFDMRLWTVLEYPTQVYQAGEEAGKLQLEFKL